MPVRVRITPFVLMLLLGFSASASAQSQGSETGDEQIEQTEDAIEDDEALDEQQGDAERAEERFNEGARLYYEGDYGGAAVEFRRAHQAHPHPLFLYNFALATRELGRYEDALEAAINAHEMDQPLPPEQSAQNQGMIHSISGMLESRQIAADIAENRSVEEIDDVPESGGWGALGWGGVAAAAAGLGAMIYGGAMHQTAETKRDEYNERSIRMGGDEGEGFRQLEDEIDTARTLRNVSGLTGIGLFAVGTGLVIWEWRSSSSTDGSAMNLDLRPTGATMTFLW